MADLGNLTIKLLVDTKGFFGEMKNPNTAIDALAKKAASIRLGLNEESVSNWVKQINGVMASLKMPSNINGALGEAIRQTVESQKASTSEMQRQVTMSAEMEKVFTDIAGTLRSIAEMQEKISNARAKSSAAAVQEKQSDEQRYDLARMRQMAEQNIGKLTSDQIAVLKAMESIERSLVAIDEQHHTNLAKTLRTLMETDGITRAQLGTYQAIVTQMQAMGAKKRKSDTESLARVKGLLTLETSLVRIDERRLTYDTRMKVEKARTYELSSKELSVLQKEVNLEIAKIKAAEKSAAATKKKEEAERKSAESTKKSADAEALKAKHTEKTNSKLKVQSGLLSQIKSYLGMYVSVIGAANVVRSIIRITGEFEAQHTALRAILQDVAGADRIFNQLQELAVKSPFTFRNLTEYAKQLTAFSVPMNEIFDTTKRLADVSAGLGVDMGRIILAYGQVRSAEFLRGQEVRQFTEAGIPILSEIAKQFEEIEGRAISVGEIFDRISARQVPFEMVDEAFRRMTSEGGKFYKMQEVLAETVKGKVSNLTDAWEIMLSKIGEQNSGMIKDAVNRLTGMLKNYEKWLWIIKEIIGALGVYAVSIAAYSGVLKTLNVISATRNILEKTHKIQLLVNTKLHKELNTVQAFGVLVKKKDAAALAALNVVMKSSIFIASALIAAIIGIVKHGKRAREESMKTTNTINSAISRLQASYANFEIGTKKVEDAFTAMQEKEGDATNETKKFEEAVDDLRRQFPDFISDNVKLAGTIDELKENWVKARIEMNKYYADEAKNSIRTDLDTSRDEAVGKIEKKLGKYISGLVKDNLTANTLTQTVWRYITGSIDENEIMGVISTLSSEYNKKSGNNRDYTRSILKELNKFLDDYNKVVNKYKDAVNNAENAIDATELSSTRKTVNEMLFSLAGGADSRLFSNWINNPGNDLAMRAEEEVDEWAARQREQLASSDVPETIKSVIRDAFKNMDIPESLDIVDGWRKDVNDVVDKFGVDVKETLNGLGMQQDEINAFVDKNFGDGSRYKVKITDTLDKMLETWIKDLGEIDTKIAQIPLKYQSLTNDTYSSLWMQRQFLRALLTTLYGSDENGNPNIDFSGAKEDRDRDRKWNEYKRKQIADINQRFQDLKEIKEAYESFKNIGFSDNQINSLLMNYFGEGVPEGGFNVAFEGLAVKMEKYDKNSAKDIRNFIAAKDWKKDAKAIEDAKKAAEKYGEAIEDLQANTKRLKLTGFAQELDKIIVDADSKNRQLQTDWDQKAKELEEAKEGWISEYRIKNNENDEKVLEAKWQEYYDKQTKMAQDAIDTQREYNNKVAQEQINDKANAWVEEMMKEGNIDLSDMSDKSLGQMEVIVSRLRSLISSKALASLVPDELKADMALINGGFETLLENIEDIVNTKIGDVEVEKMKKILGAISSGIGYLGLSADTGSVQDAYANYAEKLREAGEATKALNKARKETMSVAASHDIEAMTLAFIKLHDAEQKSAGATAETEEALANLKMNAVLAGVQAFASGLENLGVSLEKLGQAKGDESLVNFGNALNTISKGFSDAAGAAMAGAKIGGVWGAAIGAALSAIKTLAESATNSLTKAEEYNRRMKLSTYGWELSVQQLRHEYDLLQERLDTLFGSATMSKMRGWAKIIREQGEVLREFNESRQFKQLLNDLQSRDDKKAVEAMMELLAIEGNRGNVFDAATLANTSVKTRDRSWLEEMFGSKDEYKTLSEIVPELFDELGGINFDYLDTFKDTEWYDQLSDEWKAMLDKMAEANKTFQDATEEMAEYLEGIFGQVGSSISSSMISAFEQTGAVAIDTGDILSQVAKKFIEDWTQSFLMQEYLGDLSGAITDIWKNQDISMEEQVHQSLALVRDSLVAMEDSLPYIQQFYEGLDDQFHWADDAGESMGDAIKTAMVEQNSSLMAGYINSIRADLSMQRNVIIGSISPAVTNINDTLNNHLEVVTGIAGNVQRIWDRLNQLTTPGNGVKLDARI